MKSVGLKVIRIGMLLLLFQFESNAQPGGYEINGHIDGLREGEKVSMKLFKNQSGNYTTDSGYVVHGLFHLKGTVPYGPRQYWLTFENHRKYAVLLINNGERIKISGTDIEKMSTRIQDELIIEGSPTMTSALRLESAMMLYSGTVSALNRELKKIKDSIGYNEKLVAGLILARNAADWALENFVLYAFRSGNTIPYFLNGFSAYTNHAYFLADEYNNLRESEKKSFYGSLLKESATLAAGQDFPNFTLPDINGNPLSLKDVVAKSKITLVHFWASNSFERKRYQEELRYFYNKYHNKGLAIIGLSSDTNAAEWKVRVDVEKYPWYNVSDLKGSNGIVEEVYHEYGFTEVPNTTNVLIDGNGKIIAWDVNGVELQWYMDKYFADTRSPDIKNNGKVN